METTTEERMGMLSAKRYVENTVAIRLVVALCGWECPRCHVAGIRPKVTGGQGGIGSVRYVRCRKCGGTGKIAL